MILVATLLERTLDHYGAVPEQYHLLIKELGLCTPVSVLLPTHDSKDFQLLEDFLLQKEDIFSDYKTTKKVTSAFPLVIKMINQILSCENTKFLPPDVTGMFLAMLD